jgi:hypothetical protein
MKIIITENKINEIAIKWLNKKYGDLEPFETEKYPHHVFYQKNGITIFDYNRWGGDVYIANDDIWKLLKSLFSMSYEQIQNLTTLWVRKYYKIDVYSTYPGLQKKRDSRSSSFKPKNVVYDFKDINIRN